MSEDADNFNNRIPEFNAMVALQQRLAQKATNGASNQSPTSKGTIDPYQMMMQRRAENAGEVASPVQSWPEADIQKLEDFCRKHGIFGFNCGRMSPLAALSMLKSNLGIIDEFPKTEGYGPNYPYESVVKKKVLLKG